MRLTPAIFAVGLAILPAQAQKQIGPVTPIGATTVQTFLAGCAVDRNGCGLAVGSALLNKIDVANGPAQVCAPTGSDLGGPVSDWLRSHAQTRSLPAEDAIFDALKALYPCGNAQVSSAAAR